MWTPEGKRLWAGEYNKTPKGPRRGWYETLMEIKTKTKHIQGNGKKEQVEVQGTQMHRKGPKRCTAFLLGSLMKVVFHHTEPVHKD